MFDDIDFLSPHSTSARPRRQPAPRREKIELVRPSAEKKPSFWKRLTARVPELLSRYRKALPPPSPMPQKLPPAPRVSSPAAPKVKEERTAPHAAAPKPSVAAPAVGQRKEAHSAVVPSSAPTPLPPIPIPPHTSSPSASAPQEEKVSEKRAGKEEKKIIIASGKSSDSSPRLSLLNKLKRALHKEKDAAALSKDSDAGEEGVLEVNLLPERERLRMGYRQRVIIATTLSAFFVLATLGVALALHLRTNLREQELQLVAQEIAEVEREMVQNASDLSQVLALQKRSSMVAALLQQHTRWLSFLSFIEEITSRDVYYEGFSADRSGNVKLKAYARNFQAAAEQLTTFIHDPRVKKVSLSSVNAKEDALQGAGEVIFDIQLTIDPVIIMPRITAAEIAP